MAKRKQSKIKSPESNQSGRLVVTEAPDYDKLPAIFSLEKMVGDKYCFSNLDDTSKKQFAESIFKRRQLTWNEIKKIDRHGLGFEKIKKDQIKGKKPSNITEDFDNFLAFRFCAKRPMVGYREKNIFYVLWFDHDYTLYPHS